ncbi:MAG: hypothetical protein LBL18_00385 [Bacteroidales bacterium]|nr:hypothetical protein [Bacteroidales bacterium]
MTRCGSLPSPDAGHYRSTVRTIIRRRHSWPSPTRTAARSQAHRVNGFGIPSGNYIYSITANGLQLESGKIVVAK